MTGCAREIPDELITGQRQPIGRINGNQQLYRRVSTDAVDADGTIHHHAFDRPRSSVNVSKFSAPEHVLLPIYLDMGIIKVPSDLVPEETRDGENRVVDIFVEHKPEPANYAHCEIDAERGARPVKSANRAWLQAAAVMADKAFLVKQPEISDAELRAQLSERRAFWNDHVFALGKHVWAIVSPTAN